MVRSKLDPVGHRILLAVLQNNLHPECGFTLFNFTLLHVLQ
jgi:hypothetical protein